MSQIYLAKFWKQTWDVADARLKETLNTESKFLHHNQLSINNLKQAGLENKTSMIA